MVSTLSVVGFTGIISFTSTSLRFQWVDCNEWRDHFADVSIAYKLSGHPIPYFIKIGSPPLEISTDGADIRM